MHRLHCSYHKCLTVFYGRVFRALYGRLLPFTRGYKHFRSFAEEFYRELGRYRVMSVNNHALDPERLGDFRLTRFVRDPRDLVVSGYFYHRRGAEAWSRKINPSERDWAQVNGVVPEGLREDESYSGFLSRVDKDAGLMAEIQFRRRHFDSMLEWPLDDPRIRLYRYEDVVGREIATISEILSFYELSWLERRLGRWVADRASASRQAGATAHIRDPASGQWSRHFSPAVTEYFERRHRRVLERYRYPRLGQ